MTDSSPKAVRPSFGPGSVVLDRYRVDKLIGEGGMGSVYEATHLVTSKRVAIKCLHADAGDNDALKKCLIREAKISARVAHPNVVDIYDVGSEGDAVVLVMELLRGQSLASWLRELGTGSPETIFPVVIPALHGLAAIHAAGIVHRDLKPQNVFVCEDANGAVLETKILDFGIAYERNSVSRTLTMPGQIVGTPAYMSPEQFEGTDIDARADIYACGVMLYEAFSGRTPFPVESLARLLRAVLDETPVHLHELRPDLPKHVADAVMRAMARDPDARPSDIPMLVRELDPAGLFSSGGRMASVMTLRQPRVGAGSRVVRGVVIAISLIMPGSRSTRC